MVGKTREIIDAIAHAATTDPHEMPEPLWLIEAEELLEARNRLDALIARRLQAGDVRDVTVNECGRQTRSWLIEEQRLSRRDAQRRLWLARALPEHPAVADLFGAGRISGEHAHLIIDCLKALDPQWREATQDELLAFAADHDPGLLAALIRAVKVRTGAEESAEARAQRQYDNRFLHLHDTYDGTVRLDGMVDPASAAILRAAMGPLLTGTGPADQRTAGQLRADALLALAQLSLKVHGSADLTQRAGLAPSPSLIVTTIDYTELRDGITATQLPGGTLNGTPITPATARMLACEAGIIPAVLNGKSEVLDLGRSTRVWTTAQRRAAALRDGGCVWPGCQVGLEHCHLHHLDFWANLGRSDHDKSAYLCMFHHWLVHHKNWAITRNSAGLIEIHRT